MTGRTPPRVIGGLDKLAPPDNSGGVDVVDVRGRTGMQAMTVRVRNRAAETPWGSGLTNPQVQTITIPAVCPTCGGERGEPRNLNQCDDGAHYAVDVWDNPCGHVDSYTAVIAEATQLKVGQSVGAAGHDGSQQ